MAFKIKEFRNIIFYLIIGGFVPSFGSFSYYFLLDVVKISKFTYSMLTVIAFMGLGLGTSMYNRFFKETEYRKMIIIDALITIFFSPLSFIFILRLNL